VHDGAEIAPIFQEQDVKGTLLRFLDESRNIDVNSEYLFTGHRNNVALEAFFRRIDATVLYKPFSLASLEWATRRVLEKLT
jgi:hypothetical protein